MARKQYTPRGPFDSKVERIPESGCWLWLGAVNNKGYGRIRVDRQHYLAHRWSWMLYRGALADDVLVLHRCDVPCCVNPNHLFLGNHVDNAVDMVRKGRNYTPDSLGINNPSAILSEADVRSIRQLRAQGYTLDAIGRQFGVTIHCVWRIIHGRTWKHVT